MVCGVGSMSCTGEWKEQDLFMLRLNGRCRKVGGKVDRTRSPGCVAGRDQEVENE